MPLERPAPKEPQTDAQLADFYKKRAKKPDLYAYDGKGGLVIRNKDGSIESSIDLPQYRPFRLEEVVEQQERYQQGVAEAEEAFEQAMDELRTVIVDYTQGRALASAVKDQQLEVERADERRSRARFALQATVVISGLKYSELFPEQRYNVRAIDHPIYKNTVREFPLRQSYVKVKSAGDEAAEEAEAEAAREAAETDLPLEPDVGITPSAPAPKSNVLILFNKPDDNEYGYLANEYPVEFSWKGVRYFTVDQALAAEKARHYGDMTALQQILKTRSATTMRSVARKLGAVPTAAQAAEAAMDSETAAAPVPEATDSKATQWEAMRDKTLVSVLLAKFRQHIALGRQLMETGDAQIAYAEPRNNEDGIGLPLTDPRAGNPAKWRGKNRLGEALVEVRQQLRGGKQEITATEAAPLVAETISQADYEAKRAQQAQTGAIIRRRIIRSAKPPTS